MGVRVGLEPLASVLGAASGYRRLAADFAAGLHSDDTDSEAKELAEHAGAQAPVRDRWYWYSRRQHDRALPTDEGDPSAAPTSSPLRADADGVGGDSNGNFNIELVKIGDSDAKYDAFFAKAKQRWEQIITGDNVMDIPADKAPPDGWFSNFFEELEPYIAAVDDITIAYRISPIDGYGLVLGETSIIRFRTEQYGSFPISAAMTFDTEDVDGMIDDGVFESTILHEMGHALGFSANMWALYASKCGASCAAFDDGAPGGCAASRTYARLGLPGQLRMHAAGGAGDGQYCGHWDELQLGDELMTPVVGSGMQPLTAITVAAYQDMGYEVSYETAAPIELITTVPEDSSQSWPLPFTRSLLSRRKRSTFVPRAFELA